MTALTERHDAQAALNAPKAMTLADAGKCAERVHTALTDLLDVVEHDGRRGDASPSAMAAARNVREAQR